MGKRRDARLLAVQFLYQHEVGAKQDPQEILPLFWNTTEAKADLQKLAQPAIEGVLAHYDELNGIITRYAQNWGLDRMAALDRNILRLALYEMHFCPDIPPVVSINEAIEIAKQLSTEDSGKFVNGILDRAIQDLTRSAREPAPSPKSTAT